MWILNRGMINDFLAITTSCTDVNTTANVTICYEPRIEFMLDESSKVPVATISETHAEPARRSDLVNRRSPMPISPFAPAELRGTMKHMTLPSDGLRVKQTGKLTIVDFGGQDVPTDSRVTEYLDYPGKSRRRIPVRSAGVRFGRCEVVPSGLLGLLVALHKLGPEIHLYHASDEIRQALEITNLDRLIKLRVKDE